jgi:hypothetical protein
LVKVWVFAVAPAAEAVRLVPGAASVGATIAIHMQNPAIIRPLGRHIFPTGKWQFPC